jgi:hypothetical protein
VNAKKFLKIIALIGALVAVLFVVVSLQPAAPLEIDSFPYEFQRLEIGSGVIEAMVADTPDKRVLGLSNSGSLAPDEGMLFVFDRDDSWGIWMKQMRYAIDIIWMDQDLTVVHYVENVSPDTYPTVFESPTPARYVLEVPNGTIQKNSVNLGTEVVLID